MIKNYIKIAIRSIVRQRIYSAINIIGLAVGIASVALIFLFVKDEMSYDKFHKDGDRIYKVSLERMYPTHSSMYDVIPHSYAEVMVQDIPEIEAAVRIPGFGNNVQVINYVDDNGEQHAFEEDGAILADSNFFKFFTFEMISGDSESILEEATNVVMTESTAKRYFGDSDPLGKTITFGNNQNKFKVAGICKDVPANSHFKFNMVGSLRNVPFIFQPNFIGFTAHTYIKLSPDADPNVVESKIPGLVDNYAAAAIEQNLNTPYADYIAAGNGYRYFLRPLTEIHLDPTNLEAKFEVGGSLTYVYIFISIAALILIIACINFMNLATARSVERAKEVGVRKTLGSVKKQLIFQFLAESILVSLIAMIVAVGLVYAVLPEFNALAQKNLLLELTGPLIPSMLGFALVVGLLAGSYPALVLSAFDPAVVLKGSMKTNKNGSFLRNGLVVFQFAVSILLIVGTLVVKKQMDYMRNKDLGYDKENILVIRNAFNLGPNVETFVNDVELLANVSATAVGTSMPGDIYFGIQFQPEGTTEIVTTKGVAIDDDFAELMKFELIEGRLFSREFNDSASILVNQAALDIIGTDNPIGATLTSNFGPQVAIKFTIVGIIKDYHFMSLRDEISPIIVLSQESGQGGPGVVAIKVSGNYEKTIEEIEQKWTQLSDGQPFKYTFQDAELDNQYQNEKASGQIFGIFATLAIIIACVGLFGLAAYTAGLRTKEIGVRKVMGASVLSVVKMLSLDFTKLILIAFVFAAPLAWYAMNYWLEGFAYATKITVGVFVIAGASALTIALLTVSYQSIKAAVVNPVESLRSE